MLSFIPSFASADFEVVDVVELNFDQVVYFYYEQHPNEFSLNNFVICRLFELFVAQFILPVTGDLVESISLTSRSDF